jgi:tRNA(adenine34) deaminase
MKDPAARDDRYFMTAALREAEKAAEEGEVPIGAIVVRNGKVLARGSNRPVRTSDPSAHAEIVALRRAAKKSANYRLPDCDLYVTVEPCAMCLGAAVQARVRRLVYGALDPKAGAVRSIMTFPFGKANHRPELLGGLMAETCGRLLQDFFRRKRNAGRGRKP